MKLKSILMPCIPMLVAVLAAGFLWQCGSPDAKLSAQEIEEGFKNPPVTAKPGVYWYFMDGNHSKEGITKDLESMVRVGISHVIFLEVNVGVPRGKVDLMSPEWKDMYKHMVSECERLGVQLTLGIGPGWAGSGGPWVKPEESMQHLVSSSVVVEGASPQTVILPEPEAKAPFFGEGQLSPEQRRQRQEFYEDVAVLAFPTPEGGERLSDTDERALYYRAPYSSQYGVKQYLPMPAEFPDAPASAVSPDSVVVLESRLLADGTLEATVPAGKWTVMRFGARNNGAITRPAPVPGEGFEADKLDTVAMYHHLEDFVGELFRTCDFKKRTPDSPSGGFTMLHIDSWEMGAQNWTPRFREEFLTRRGYDPEPFYPAYSGVIVGSREKSERFLWDVRKTVQELIAQNHAGYVREYAHRHGLGLSIEPYDMNPIADLELCAEADVPMCEFWSIDYGFNTTFSLTEGTSMAHLKGVSVVPAESFTAMVDGWAQYPGKIKNQTDWALAGGVNRFMFHTFQHQCLPDSLRPGMTMAIFGVHWDRGQTWWEMGKAYHEYLARCQFLLQQGRTVSDVLYFCPEGNPHVFRAPSSAYQTDPNAGDTTLYSVPNGPLARVSSTEYTGVGLMPDKRGYAFDACPPGFLRHASVKDGRVVFPGGAEYRILVLPLVETMTPEILMKIRDLLRDGATVVGMPPAKSPSLQNYPACDAEIASLVQEIWGDEPVPVATAERRVGEGTLIWGEELVKSQENLYPGYDFTARILESRGIPEDFSSDGSLRYAHRTAEDIDLYFVSNRAGKPVTANCSFRIDGKIPELWDPMTGEIRDLEQFSCKDGLTVVPMQFDTDQSFFVVFRKQGGVPAGGNNFPELAEARTLDGPWSVSFDPKWGGPANATFDRLIDWSKSDDEGIRYYSGTAVYEQTFDAGDVAGKRLFLDLGEVNIMAKVWLNGREVGTVWTSPWQLDITGFVRPGGNELKIEVVNLWINRLVGDASLPDDGIRDGRWPEWLSGAVPHKRTRYTFTTFQPYSKDTPLVRSGLEGPVRLLEAK